MRVSYSATILSFGLLIAGLISVLVEISTHRTRSPAQPFQLRWSDTSGSNSSWRQTIVNPPLPATGYSSTLLRRTEDSSSTDSSLLQLKHGKDSSKKDSGKGKSKENSNKGSSKKGSGKGKSTKGGVDVTDTLIIAKVGIVCDIETDSGKGKGSKGKSDKSNKGSSGKGNSGKGSGRRRQLNSDTVACNVESLFVGLLVDQFAAFQGVCPKVASLDSSDGDVEISLTCVDERRELAAVPRTRGRPGPGRDEDEIEEIIATTSPTSGPTSAPTGAPVAVTMVRRRPTPGQDEDEVEEVIATTSPTKAPSSTPTYAPTNSPVAVTRTRIRPVNGKDEDEVVEVIDTASPTHSPTNSPVATTRRRRRPSPYRDEDEEESDVEGRDEESGEKEPNIFQHTTSRCDDGVPTKALAFQSVGESLSCIILEFDQEVDFSDLSVVGLSLENQATMTVSGAMP
jgi:hypothetical protein